MLRWSQIIKTSRLASRGWHGLWWPKRWPLLNLRPGHVYNKSCCWMHRRPVHCTPRFHCSIEFSVSAGFVSLRHNLPLSLLSLSFIGMTTRWRMLSSSSSITTFSSFLCCIYGQELFQDWKHKIAFTLVSNLIRLCFADVITIHHRCDSINQSHTKHFKPGLKDS